MTNLNESKRHGELLTTSRTAELKNTGTERDLGWTKSYTSMFQPDMNHRLHNSDIIFINGQRTCGARFNTLI